MRISSAVVVLAALLAAPAARAQEFKVIGTEELAAKLAAVPSSWDFVLVDARTQVEFSEAHIQGSVLVPARLVSTKLPGVAKDRSRTVIFYCNGPNCTKTVKAGKAAAAIGYTSILEYKEGLPGWAKSGRKTEGRPLPAFDAPVIAAAELKALLAGGTPPVLVDIRDPEEHASFHVAESISVPIDDLAAWAKKAPAGRSIVIMDHAGHQAPVAARVLHDAGRSDLKRLDGGILKWQGQGLPVVAAK
ncbi:MAG TPA: rhodanese-like domain-containing protein [Anaeromyxobacteraceae bacterium]|nr:rhodanese-like domain-containing protein [Anaeromyxobacteraceae bacterium]